MKTKLSMIIVIALLICSKTSIAQTKTSSTEYEIKNEDLKGYVGIYNPETQGRAFSITVSLNSEDRLMAQPTNKSEPNTLLVATKKDHFKLSGTPLAISFNRNEKEEIISLTFSQGSQSFNAILSKEEN